MSRARDAARTAACISNQKQCGLGYEIHANEFDDYYPVTNNLSDGDPNTNLWGPYVWDCVNGPWTYATGAEVKERFRNSFLRCSVNPADGSVAANDWISYPGNYKIGEGGHFRRVGMYAPSDKWMVADGHSDMKPDSLPMFQTVFADRTVEIGIFTNQSELVSMDIFASKLAEMWVRGRQLGWFNTD